MDKSIDIQIRTTYSTQGEISDQTKNIWIACHGYGQLAEYFIKNFDCLDQDSNFIIAPQAISKLYLGGVSGRVGASWMTKYQREMEIDNYVGLISAIYQQETEGKDISHCKIILFGFSQGCATISRWALKSGIHFDALVLWTGNFPHDVDHEAAAKILANKDFRLLIGTEDEYFNRERVNQHLKHLNEQGLHPDFTIFEGKHKIYDEELLKMGF